MMLTPKTGLYLLSFIVILISGCNVFQNRQAQRPWDNGRLIVSENGRFLQHENGEPFFWLGDTGWLMFQRLSRDEVKAYLENRRRKGFNVIQAMVLHGLPEGNVYGSLALFNNNPMRRLTTPGNSPKNESQYDYWDHVDFVVETAAKKGIYIAMLPVWGGIIKGGYFTEESARSYGKWLAQRYGDKPNIIWINGGDIRGDSNTEIWQALGTTLHQTDSDHLMTFHPLGRTQSSTWFHDEDWLDFNMFQSGHRRYDQRRPNDDIATWKGGTTGNMF